MEIFYESLGDLGIIFREKGKTGTLSLSLSLSLHPLHPGWVSFSYFSFVVPSCIIIIIKLMSFHKWCRVTKTRAQLFVTLNLFNFYFFENPHIMPPKELREAY